MTIDAFKSTPRSQSSSNASSKAPPAPRPPPYTAPESATSPRLSSMRIPYAAVPRLSQVGSGRSSFLPSARSGNRGWTDEKLDRRVLDHVLIAPSQLLQPSFPFDSLEAQPALLESAEDVFPSTETRIEDVVDLCVWSEYIRGGEGGENDLGDGLTSLVHR